MRVEVREQRGNCDGVQESALATTRAIAALSAIETNSTQADRA
jgi:hypothetical protein